MEKRTDVRSIVENAWWNGSLRVNSIGTFHSGGRVEGRAIEDEDLRAVVLYGYREEQEDEDKGGHWTYSIRNKDVNGRDIRIIVDVEADPRVVVVTVMHVYP